MKRLCGTFLGVLVVSPALAQELRRDPFEAIVTRDVPGTESQSGPVTSDGIPRLRATLVSGDSSLAIVGTEIVAVGAELGAYRLESVAEGYAVFSKDGELMRVSVQEDANNDDSGVGRGE